jgi:hypothetical protein
MFSRRHALPALGLVLAAATAGRALSTDPDEVLGLFAHSGSHPCFIKVRHILDKADLTHATFFQGADLEDADFKDMTLKHANLQGTRCDRADFLNADCTGAVFDRVDLTTARNLARAVVKDATFMNATIKAGDLPLLIRLDADLRGVLLGGAEPELPECKVQTLPGLAPEGRTAARRPGPIQRPGAGVSGPGWQSSGSLPGLVVPPSQPASRPGPPAAPSQPALAAPAGLAPDLRPPGSPALPTVPMTPGEHSAWQMHRLALAFTSRLAWASGIPGIDPAALRGISDTVEAALRAGCHALDAEVKKISQSRSGPHGPQPRPSGLTPHSSRPLRPQAEPFQPSWAVSSQEPEQEGPD